MSIVAREANPEIRDGQVLLLPDPWQPDRAWAILGLGCRYGCGRFAAEDSLCNYHRWTERNGVNDG
jgi:hypothetical protein